MLHLRTQLPLMLPMIVLLASCEDEPVPAYLFIPSFTVTAGGLAGSSSANISDAWVYQNGNLQGVYELPAHFPIVSEGSDRLVVFAGIKLNGIAATRAAYPFYAPDTIDIMLEATIADTIFPSIAYSSNSEFDFIEDFETGSGFTGLQSGSEEVFEGIAAGKFTINDSTESLALSDSAYAIPFITPAAFLEMNYKNSHEFDVGIRAHSGSETLDLYKLTVPPRNDWNKIYVNLTPEILQLQADSYQIFFRKSAGSGSSSVKIYFDNLKLIHAKTQ